MNIEYERANTGFKISEIMMLYFSLYFTAVLATSFSMGNPLGLLFGILFFPAGFPIGKRTEEWIPLLLGYFFYTSILILMTKFRNKSKFVIGAFVIFILVLILNIRGCYMLYDGFSLPT